MGDRALIVTKNKDLAVYLHSHGHPEFVEPILTYCGLQAFHSPEQSAHGWMRLCQVLSNYIRWDRSFGIFPYDVRPLAFDNGEYVVENWRVVERSLKDAEPLPDDFDMQRQLHAIDACMPEREQLGLYIDSVVIPVEEVEPGMIVWGWNFANILSPCTVMGFGPQEAEEELRGKPYLNHHKSSGEEYWMHRENYLLEDFVHIIEPTSWHGRVSYRSWEKPSNKLW